METDEPLDLIKSGAIGPWEQLNLGLAEQKAVEARGSLEAADAASLAIEVRRLAGLFGLDSGDMSKRSTDWAMMSVAADTGSKRLLSSAARRTELVAASYFEADDNGKYRFLNNRLLIVDPKGDSADFLTAAGHAILFLIGELGIEIGWTPAIIEGPRVFKATVVLDAGPDPDRVFRSLQIRFCRRDHHGELVKFDPQNWELDLKTSGGQGNSKK
jgi:hypothetical protein